MKVRLINPRGRVIEVDKKEAENLLAKGFLKAPEGASQYNPIFDKGPNTLPQNIELKEIKKQESDILKVIKI